MKFRPAFLFHLVLFYSCAGIRPEAPVPITENIPLPPPVISVVNMPVELDLKPYFILAEKNVPTNYEGSENPCEGIRYAYQFLRGPFRISGLKDNLSFSFEGKYKIKGSYCGKCLNEICLLPTPAFSCGYLEPMRTIDVGYVSKIKLMPDWRLSSQTSLVRLQPRDKCAVSFINIDITGKLMQVMKDELESAGKSVDSQFRAYDLKPYVREVWNKLFEVQPVEKYGYLSVNPVSFSISDLSMSGSKLNMILGLGCKPVFSSAFVQSVPVSLPDLSGPVKQHGFNVDADLLVNYDDLSRILNQQLAGAEWRIKKKKVIVNKIEINGLGRSKISMQLDFGGSKKGIVYLIGTPVFDSVKNTIHIPDLAFELKSRNVLLKTANWLLNDRLTSKIRTAAVFDMSRILQQYKGTINTQLNKQLTAAVRIYGSVDSMKVNALLTSPQSLFLRVHATGQLGIKMK
jgi:hypothetical protein